LRQAIIDSVSGNTITFDPSLSGQTVVLSTTLIIDKDLIIDGSALVSKISISGNNSTRVFDVIPGITVTTDSLIIKNGKSSSYGGGIHNEGSLTVKGSIFSGNHVMGNVAETRVVLSRTMVDTDITDSIFAENSTEFNQTLWAGAMEAIYSANGTLTIAYSTFNNNNA
jgi:hypothetical protein